MTTSSGRRIKSALVALVLSFCAGNVGAQITLTDAQAKAAFLVNFARYVDWPQASFARQNSPIVFCMIGRDALRSEMNKEEFLAVQIRGRSMAVHTPLGGSNFDGCHVLFIAETEAGGIEQILKRTLNKPILTVSDMPAFIDRGGAIGLIRIGKKYKFEINRDTLNAANLNASSNLLKLARNLKYKNP